MEFFCEKIQAHTERGDCQNCCEYHDCVETGNLAAIDKKLKPQLPKPEDHKNERDSKKEKTGSVEWVQNQLFHRWQVVRRHPEYVEFCRGRNFTNGYLHAREMLKEPKAEEVMQKFGLELIYDPSLDIPKDNFIGLCIFKDTLAVSYELRTEPLTDEELKQLSPRLKKFLGENFEREEDKPFGSTRIWDDHFIRLEIDITKRVKRVGKEVRELVKEARGSADIQKLKRKEGYRKDALAVSSQSSVDDNGVRIRIWDDRFIKLKIDITKKLSQIDGEVRKRVEEARQTASIQEPDSRLREREEVYKVWDLTEQGKSKKAIIAELWPDEWQAAVAGTNNTDADNYYKELCARYEEQGVEDLEERAFNEAYGKDTNTKTIQAFYMRVKERLDTMEEEFKKVIIKK